MSAALDPAPARRGLDWLLASHPGFAVLLVDYGRSSLGDDGEPIELANPWIIVELGQASDGGIEAYAVHRYAIWKNTGAVHPLDHDGAASDDPVFTPSPAVYERIGVQQDEHQAWVAAAVELRRIGFDLNSVDVATFEPARVLLARWAIAYAAGWHAGVFTLDEQAPGA